MTIIDLGDDHRALFAACLEDWSDEVRESGDRRARWVECSLAKGLRAKLAVGEHGVVGGMIQYLPIEQSTVQGTGLYFIPCIWVHGHKQGRGNFQGHGMGSVLLEAAEADVRALGGKGLAAWGLWLPFWMKASWFKRHGYRKADRQGVAVLLWKPFTDDAQPPRWYPKGKILPDAIPGKVHVTAFVNGWCTGMNLAVERARRAAAELGDKVVYREIDTSEPAAVAKWGFSDALFVDRKAVRIGPAGSAKRLVIRGLVVMGGVVSARMPPHARNGRPARLLWTSLLAVRSGWLIVVGLSLHQLALRPIFFGLRLFIDFVSRSS